MTENCNVREAAKIPLWKIAAAIQISEPTLTRWLRFPLPDEKEKRIMSAIAKLKAENWGGGADAEASVQP